MTTKTIPQVKGDFFLGNLRQFKVNPFQTFCDWHRDYGDLVNFRLATRQFYLFSHPQLVELALIKQSHNFVKPYNPEKPTALALVSRQGLVTSQGDLWRKQRRLMQPIFQRSNLISMLPQMILAGNNLLQRWEQLGDGAQVNLASEMMHLTLEIITQTMFSTSVLDRIAEIEPALRIGIKYASQTQANPLIPPLCIPTPANQEFKRAMALLDDIMYGMIEQHRSQSTPQHDLLTMLLNARDENGEAMSDRQIRDEVITIFIAGHETTANLLTWTLYLLAKHPDVLEKLRTELREHLQGGIPDAETLQKLVYTRAVLNESLRIRPPANTIIRKIVQDTEIDGYPLKAGRLAVFSIYNIHHHPDYWPEPEKFDPDRFLTTENRRFAFMPFGTGERICIGNHFAMLESQLLLSMILQNYDVQLLNNDEVEVEMAVTMRPKGGIPVQLKRR
ncbi:cytochrome P450 [Methylobacter marinus]|uniref:cytochrome P450 n=1 Tax=Methylobacter marinus TaxID=34058 RepID=UPI00036AC090|nr:cytochrome P450 [Methylobacter marinus]